jgi:hypothetical protein
MQPSVCSCHIDRGVGADTLWLVATAKTPSPPEQHPRWRNTGRALAPPLLDANLLYDSPAEGSGRPACYLSAMVKDRPRAIAPSSPSPTSLDSLPPPRLHPGHGLLLGEQRGGRVRCQFWLPSFYVGWRGRSRRWRTRPTPAWG